MRLYIPHEIVNPQGIIISTHTCTQSSSIMLIINVGALHYITLLYTILFIEELEKWDLPKIDAIQKKVEAIELQQRKLFNAVIDMRYVHNLYKNHI